jgi:hypothetical protein
MTTSASKKQKVPASPSLKLALAAARRMGRMVREENRRFGLPLIVRQKGKIVSIEP